MIIVTAPTGAIGHQVLENVLQGQEPIRVIARDPSRLPPHARDRIDVVQGSHSDAAVVNKAFAGADAVFWLVPPDPRAKTVDAAYVDFTRPACAAFKTHGVKRVVGISALGRGTPAAAHAGLVTASLKMDDLIASAGAHYRAVTNPSFMDNLLRQVELIKTKGIFSLPIAGDLKQPSASTRDIAATAAKLLLDQSWTGVGSVPVLGPEDLSYNDMATIMSEVLGKPVRFQEMPRDTFKAGLLQRGMSEAMAQATLDMWIAYGQGLDTAEPRTPQSATPTSFQEWCEGVLKPRVMA
ncbi:MAG TPA: NAD(P)H-binding protein [Vicinamibacterales bacterium]|jgi:uncharacterized protein YbjT (DUF2867 family)|nr:NAD(P)H-binding protein [Vicinamibacterales bacterium]